MHSPQYELSREHVLTVSLPSVKEVGIAYYQKVYRKRTRLFELMSWAQELNLPVNCSFLLTEHSDFALAIAELEERLETAFPGLKNGKILTSLDDYLATRPQVLSAQLLFLSTATTARYFGGYSAPVGRKANLLHYLLSQHEATSGVTTPSLHTVMDLDSVIDDVIEELRTTQTSPWISLAENWQVAATHRECECHKYRKAFSLLNQLCNESRSVIAVGLTEPVSRVLERLKAMAVAESPVSGESRKTREQLVSEQVKLLSAAGETFKQHPRFPDYWVSDYGRVASAKKYAVCLLKPSLCSGGYLRFVLTGPDRKKKFEYAHRLVAELFLPVPTPDKTVVRHLNDNPSDNRASNLAYGSQCENMADSPGKSKYSLLTEEELKLAWANYIRAPESSPAALLESIGVDNATQDREAKKRCISNLINGRAYRHISNLPAPACSPAQNPLGKLRSRIKYYGERLKTLDAADAQFIRTKMVLIQLESQLRDAQASPPASVMVGRTQHASLREACIANGVCYEAVRYRINSLAQTPEAAILHFLRKASDPNRD